jgi:hypothetical protein
MLTSRYKMNDAQTVIYDDYEPKENLTPEETKRRTATPLGQDYRHSHLDTRTPRMVPPRGEDVYIPSRGI